MTPPKRALFSLNLDSNADHIYQRVEDHNKEGEGKIKVIESTGPTVGSTNLTVLTKPFEKVVNRAVEGVIEGTGKKVHSAEGELHYEVSREEKGSSSQTVKVQKGPVKRLEDQYDTSEL